jgi:hypothetical protein
MESVFWLLVVLEILSITSMIIDPEDTIWNIIVDLAIYLPVLVGIYGYANDRRIFVRRFWQGLIPVALIYDITTIVGDEWSTTTTEEMYILVGVMIVLILPAAFFQYLAMYRYAFKAAEIWRPTT